MKLKSYITASAMSAVLSVVGAMPVMAQQQQPEKIKLNICGGEEGKVYLQVARYIKQVMDSAQGFKPFDITVYSTGGSVDNMAHMAQGHCQVAPAQKDAYNAYLTRPDAITFDPRFVSAYNEYFNLICHRDLKVSTIGELAERANSGQASTVYIGTEGSGGAITLANILGSRSEYKNINMLPNPENEALKFSPTRNAIQLAMHNKACAAWVGRAPDKVLQDIDAKQYTIVNLVDVYDRRVGKILDNKQEPMYEFVYYTDIAKDLYLKLRQLDPDAWKLKEEQSTQTVKVETSIVIDKEFEANVLGRLAAQGLTGTAQRWNRAIETIKRYNGDFSQLNNGMLNLVPFEKAPDLQ